MPYLKEQDAPAWYELGHQEHVLVFRLRPDVMAKVEDLLSQPFPIFQSLQQSWSLPEFRPPSEEKWGFGQTFQTIRSANWPEIHLNLPSENMGQDHRSNLYQTSVNAYLLFLMLMMEDFDGETTDRYQLLTIDGTSVSNRSCGVMVTISPRLAQWVERQPQNQHLASVIDTMWQEYSWMLGREHSWRGDFYAQCYDGQWLHLKVPGECACLGRDGQYADEKGGYEMYSHNVDTPLQQLTLLAGLAKLYDLASNDL